MVKTMICPQGPWEDTQTSPKPHQKKDFLHKLLVKRPGYLPGLKNSSFWKKHVTICHSKNYLERISPQSSKFRKVRKVNLVILIHLLTGITWDICYLSPKHFTQEKWHQSISLDSLNQKRTSGIKMIIFHFQHWFINNGSKWYTDIVDSKVEDSHHMTNSSKWQHGNHDCFERHKTLMGKTWFSGKTLDIFGCWLPTGRPDFVHQEYYKSGI